MKAIFTPKPLVRRVPLNTSAMPPVVRGRRGVYTEWILTNGLGGYASGTAGGLNTRRFHGWLISALPAPHGRTMMLNQLRESIRVNDKKMVLSCEDVVHDGNPTPPPEEELVSKVLAEFRTELGLPVWTFRGEGATLEKRVCVVQGQNTTYITYTLLEGRATLDVQPALDIRPHEGSLSGPPHTEYRFSVVDQGFELDTGSDIPSLKLSWSGDQPDFHLKQQTVRHLRYQVEQARGYDWEGDLWSPGWFSAELQVGKPAVLVVSTEIWDKVQAFTAAQAFAAENERRRRLLRSAPECAREGFAAEMVLAADQFLISPRGRTADQVRAGAVGDEVRSVIAGYHWFTDWGRDTMISLEGLTLSTGRHREAENILRSFAGYVQRGLIPNMFPEGKTGGLYHTADATMWFFHAIDRYYSATGDDETLEFLLPKLVDILDWHLKGTDFGIHADPDDGLLAQGQIGYQLTWMDAKVADWVVTPRRGKPVEINALWYNALRLTAEWLTSAGKTDDAARYTEQADRVVDSFNRRFWNAERGCLFDVVDNLVEKDGRLERDGDDPQVRPNQVVAFALRFPVLARDKWPAVLKVVKEELVTPVGLRSLSPREPDYKPRYDGDIWARDAAYHQGTVWAWLIGPFINAWLAAYPDDSDSVQQFLCGFEEHLSEDGVGTISEIFDADEPYVPRGCMAQAWSVAEVLRCQLLLEEMRLNREVSTAIAH